VSAEVKRSRKQEKEEEGKEKRKKKGEKIKGGEKLFRRSARDVRADDEKKCYRSQSACASSAWAPLRRLFVTIFKQAPKNSS